MDRGSSRYGKGVLAAALVGTAAIAAAGVWVGVSYAQAPRLGDATPASGGWTNQRAPRIAIDVGNGGRIDSYQVTLDGARLDDHAAIEGDELVVTGVPLADGDHRITVQATAAGMFGGELERTWQFGVDTHRPRLAIDTRLDSYIRWNAVTVQGTTEPGATVVLRSGEDSDTAVARDDGVFTVALELADGSHDYALTTTDPAGNEREQTGVLLVDATAPTVEIDAPARTPLKRPMLNATLTDAGQVTAKITLDGRPFAANRKPAQPLADGVHWLRVQATDEAGNTTTGLQRVLVNSTEKLGKAVLMKGAVGRDVKQLQRQLREQDLLAKGHVTGVYDIATVKAVRAFQTSRAMPVDGVAGTDTVGAMTTRIVIDESSHSLTLYRVGKPALSFGVAVGQSAYPTPVGEFSIITKVVDPTWVPPDSDWAQGALPIPPGPDNPLGTRWMGLSSPSVGIHGTNDPASIGYSVSHGCIRMSIPDVERLYEMVYVGTRVSIVA
jgi:hypothetical protein